VPLGLERREGLEAEGESEAGRRCLGHDGREGMGGKRNRLLVFGGVCMFVAGIPGLVEDLSTWKEWLAMLSLWKWFSVICVSVGFFLILYGLISRNGIDRIVENDELSRLAALESLKARTRFRDSILSSIAELFPVAILFALPLVLILPLVMLRTCVPIPPTEGTAADVFTEAVPGTEPRNGDGMDVQKH